MYSRKIVQASLEGFASREGWMPTPHTIEEVDEFKDYINTIVDIESNSKSSYITLNKSLSVARQKEVSKWISNEQVLCVADYSYWESRYAYVKNEVGEIVRFNNRTSQAILNTIIADLDERNLSKEIVVRSSRQGGIGTKFSLMCIHRALFSPYSNVLLSAGNSQKAYFLEQITNTAYNRCPWWLVPRRLPKRSFDNGSAIATRSGGGITHGYTPNYVYIADAESYNDPIRTMEEGLFRAVHSSPRNLLVVQGNGVSSRSSWFQNFWRYAKEYYPKGMSRFMPVFLPWYLSSDIYPTKNWLDKFPIPEKWVPVKETKDHATRCELYVRNTPILTKALGKGWKMPIEQKWYWETSYNYAKAIDCLDRYLSWMAADDEEQTDNAEVFESDVDLDKLFPESKDVQPKLNVGS